MSALKRYPTTRRSATSRGEQSSLSARTLVVSLDVRSIKECPEPRSATSRLKITSFPYILSQVILHSSPSTLAALLRCSKYLFHRAAPELYRHLRLTQRQFERMIEVGYAPLKSLSTSGILGRSFSPFLKEALPHVRSLHLLQYGPRWVMPTVPRGCLTGVETIVIHPRSDVDWQCEKEPTFPRDLRGQFKTADLVIHIPDTAIRPKTPIIDFDFKRFVKSNSNITLLIPLTLYAPDAPFFGFYNDHPQLKVTTVLLPPARLECEYHETYRRRLWAATRRIRRDLPPAALLDSHYHHMRLVGGEYLGLHPEGLKNLIEEFQDYSIKRYPIAFTSFREWLDEQSPGAFFTEHEARVMRGADREVLEIFGPPVQGLCLEVAESQQ